MNKSDYIIDFERVNQLTTSIYDDPDDKSNPFSEGKFAYAISRRMVKDYLDRFNTSKRDSDDLDHIVNTLEYNGILIHKSTLRDNKIKEILK